jgi:hypothetical protein
MIDPISPRTAKPQAVPDYHPPGSEKVGETRRPRIAVVGVHGVGDHKPGETASALASLLLGLDASGRARPLGVSPPAQPGSGSATGAVTSDSSQLYDGFSGSPIHVPLHPLAMPTYGQAPDKSGWARVRSTLVNAFNERGGYFADLRRDHAGREPTASGGVGYEFLREQLSCYAGDAAQETYVTTRLEGLRRAVATDRAIAQPDDTRSPCDAVNPRGIAADVDIYEVFWSDLRHVAKGAIPFFGALYQLLMHLPELGRQALDAAVAEQPGRSWRLLQDFHTYATRLFVLFLPLFSLQLLLVALGDVVVQGVTHKTDVANVKVPVLGGIAVASLLVSCLALLLAYFPLRRRVPGGPRRWAALPLLVGLGAGAAAWWILRAWVEGPSDPDPGRGLIVIAVDCWLATLAIVAVTCWYYRQIRPGAGLIGATAYVLSAGSFAVFFAGQHRPDPSAAYEYAALQTMQVVFAALVVIWFFLILFAWAGSIAGWFSVRRIQDLLARARARSAVRTARLTMALSASMAIVAVLVFWSGLVSYGIGHTRAFQCAYADAAPVSLIPYWVPTTKNLRDWNPALVKAPDEDTIQDVFRHGRSRTILPSVTCPSAPDANSVTARGYFRGLVATSVTSGIPIALGLFAVAVFLLGWAAIPAVMSDEKASSVGVTNEEMRRAGAWYTRGLDASAIVSWVVWLTIFGVLPLFAGVDAYQRTSGLPHNDVGPLSQIYHGLLIATEHIVRGVGALVAALAGGTIVAIAKYGGAALDTVLDVDNYLRVHPVTDTPAARIHERYASLLRYVNAQRWAGSGYDAVLIVAHSLGSVISADALRILYHQSHALDRDRLPDAQLSSFGFGPSATKTLVFSLFTMGNPIAQLLNRFFPHRYQWVRDEPQNSAGSSPATGLHPPLGPIAALAKPLPAELGVDSWSNAYRSADYVGRSLWTGEWYRRTNGRDSEGAYPQTIAAARDANGSRWEACIGRGAHVHYWDRSAPDIAERLDCLIAGVVGAPTLAGSGSQIAR